MPSRELRIAVFAVFALIDALIWFARFIPPIVKSAGALPTVPVSVRVVAGGDT